MRIFSITYVVQLTDKERMCLKLKKLSLHFAVQQTIKTPAMFQSLITEGCIDRAYNT